MHQINVAPELFYIGDTPENNIANIQFKIRDQTLIILHTFVSDTLKGQGIGQQLVKFAVDYAREKHLKVHPLCGYANNQFTKNPEYRDVLVDDPTNVNSD